MSGWILRLPKGSLASQIDNHALRGPCKYCCYFAAKSRIARCVVVITARMCVSKALSLSESSHWAITLFSTASSGDGICLLIRRHRTRSTKFYAPFYKVNSLHHEVGSMFGYVSASTIFSCPGTTHTAFLLWKRVGLTAKRPVPFKTQGYPTALHPPWADHVPRQRYRNQDGDWDPGTGLGLSLQKPCRQSRRHLPGVF